MKQGHFYKEKAKIVWGTNPAGWAHATEIPTGTKEFFETVVYRRSYIELPWLEDIVKFAQFKDKKVLEIGCGAGYDAYEFIKNGADYIGFDIAPENIELTKKHLGLYGYSPSVFELDAENFLFKDQRFDFIFSNGVLHHVPDIKKVFRNIHMHLTDNGSAQLIVYHKNSIFYWLYLYFYRWWWLKDRKLYNNFTERLSAIETTGTDERALVRVYTRKEFIELLESEGFQVTEIAVRHLSGSHFPFPQYLAACYDSLNKRIKKFLEQRFGWFLVVKVKRV